MKHPSTQELALQAAEKRLSSLRETGEEAIARAERLSRFVKELKEINVILRKRKVPDDS